MEKTGAYGPGGNLKFVKLKSELQWPMGEIQKRIQTIDKERGKKRGHIGHCFHAL